MDWPATEGRYKIGNRDSPVAVCTEATMEMDLPMDRISICGKCVTENIGIEKIVKNMISNPKLRFLVLCGRVSNGHFVGQAVKSLIENGVDKKKRIIGAKGGMPVLRNLSDKEIEHFRKQVTPVDMTGEMDIGKIMEKVEECWKNNPGAFESDGIVSEEVERIRAEPSDFVKLDPKGYFIILPDKGRGEIVVEHYSPDGKKQRIIVGTRAEDIFKKITELGIVSEQNHCAYLGKELARAELSMKHNFEYVQDKG